MRVWIETFVLEFFEDRKFGTAQHRFLAVVEADLVGVVGVGRKIDDDADGTGGDFISAADRIRRVASDDACAGGEDEMDRVFAQIRREI